MVAWGMQNSFDEAVASLVERHPEYAAEAYEFTRLALDNATEHFCQDRPDKHLSAEELYMGACAYALDEYGPLAWDVLHFWGIDTARDFGNIVYYLIEAGIFGKQKGDTLEQFYHLPDMYALLHSPYMPESAPEDDTPAIMQELLSRLTPSTTP